MPEKLPDWQRRQLIEKIKQGGVFIYPTDTGYGLGCSIYNAVAIKTVFKIKNRSPEKTVPVLARKQQVKELTGLTEAEKKAMERFWPGALTLVMKARHPGQLDSHIVREGTVALREPDLKELLDLLAKTGPIVGTSANIAGEPMPRRLEDVHPQLLREVDFVLGDTRGEGTSSTVAAWNDGAKEWRICREGPISKKQLNALTGG